ALRTTPNVTQYTVFRWERRRELAGRPGLWQELLALVESSEEDPESGEIDLDCADDLIEFLADRGEPDNATLVRMIGERKAAEGWLPGFLVDLAGERRLREAVPLLLDELETDAEHEGALDALAKI